MSGQWRPWPAVTGQWGKTRLIAVWNWPVVTFTWLLVRYQPEDDDDRRWFLRTRIGPVKVEVTRRR